MTELARAVRSLARTPGPTVAAVAALALGIGAATAIFSVADAVVLRPLPYAGADRLVSIEGQFLALGMRDLGASPPELADARLVLGEGVALAVAGAAIGLGAAAATGRALSTLLFEVRPADPLTFTMAAAVLVAVAAAACARPALRAARVDPAVALREE